ncbi:hypothetical protein MJ575_04800 [Klebsiella pneumoniae]|nr:hypothetical protein MJ575_04800 [Klebsiella pneumoniae]
MNAALQARVLDGADPVTCRPADLLKPELAQLEAMSDARHRRRASRLPKTPSTTYHRGAVPGSPA